MEEFAIQDAVRNASSNPESRWPSREQANRLEPFCWPGLRPTFKLKAGATVFTIGSCFARNIEKYLSDLGFDIPTIVFAKKNPGLIPGKDLGVLNRYTPPSIYQELEWVRNILDRDDRVRTSDVEPLLLDAGRGLVFDLGRLPTHEYGITPDFAIRQRRLLYRLFRSAFECDAVVITLGLIECWWDRQRQSYVEYNRRLIRHPERFAFRRLDYPMALDYVQRTVDLINRDRPTPILMTTSPVPLLRTFTPDDVIVANTYSKSVLRAVAEVVRANNSKVDYFPSFESVMLSRDKGAWMDDLIHVEPNLVSSIMLRVAKSYIDMEESTAAIADGMLQVIGYVKRGLWHEAKAANDLIDLERAPPEPAEFYVCAAEIAAREGERKASKKLIARAGKALSGDEHLRVAKILEAFGEREQGGARRAMALATVKGGQGALWNWVSALEIAARREDLEWLLDNAVSFVAKDVDSLWRIALINQKHERPEPAEGLYRSVLRLDPNHEDAGLRLGYILLQSQRQAEGLDVLERVAATGCDNLYLHPLVTHYLELSRFTEAKALLDRLIKGDPEHSGLRTLAVQLQNRLQSSALESPSPAP